MSPKHSDSGGTIRLQLLDGRQIPFRLRPETHRVYYGGARRDEGVLSARELEVLLLSARGLANARIASSLHLSEATVKRHLANVYEKMGVGSRGESAREALLRDWITIEEIKGPAPGDGQAGRG